MHILMLAFGFKRATLFKTGQTEKAL